MVSQKLNFQKFGFQKTGFPSKKNGQTKLGFQLPSKIRTLVSKHGSQQSHNEYILSKFGFKFKRRNFNSNIKIIFLKLF